MTTFRQTWSAIKLDAARYACCYRSSGFWVTLSYRIRRLRRFGHPANQLLLPLGLALGLLRWLVSDSKVPCVVPAGPGLCLPHPNGVFISDKAKLGADVSIFQQVTVGEWAAKGPTIGDGCRLFAGSKAFGDITIGSNSSVGTNAVIRTDVPPDSVAYLAGTTVTRKKEKSGKKHNNSN